MGQDKACCTLCEVVGLLSLKGAKELSRQDCATVKWSTSHCVSQTHTLPVATEHRAADAAGRVYPEYLSAGILGLSLQGPFSGVGF